MLIPLQRKRKMKLFNFSKILKTRRKCHPQGHNGKNISAENARNPLLLVIRAQFGQHNNLTGKKSELWNVQYIYNISTYGHVDTHRHPAQICTYVPWFTGIFYQPSAKNRDATLRHISTIFLKEIIRIRNTMREGYPYLLKVPSIA